MSVQYDEEDAGDNFEGKPLLDATSINGSPIDVELKVNRTGAQGSHWLESSFLVVNAALGAGLLDFPIAYDQAGGVAVAIAMQALFLVFIVGALFILAYCSDIKGVATYQDVVESVCGPKAKVASAIALFLYCFGTCITFLIIIGDQWEEFFLFVNKSLYCGSSPVYMNRAFIIILTSTVFILPLCFPKKIDFLKYASFVGVVGIVYVVGLVAVKYFLPHDPPGLIKTRPSNWIDVFSVVPTVCFAYQCHVSVIPIYSCMRNRCLTNFAKMVTNAMVMCVLAYTLTAALGYLQFGSDITSDVLLSFDPDPSVLCAVILIAIKTYTTYPILLFCGRAAFDSLWIGAWRMNLDTVISTELRRRIITTLVWYVVTIALSIFIPNIGVVIQVLGSFAAVFIFIFPGMCLLKIMLDKRDEGDTSRKILGAAIFSLVFIVLGAFIFGLTLAQAIIKDTSGGSKTERSRYTC